MSNSQNDMFQSENSSKINEGKAVHSFSAGGQLIPGNEPASQTKGLSNQKLQKVKMVTSTPLLTKSKQTETISNGQEALDEEHMLFNAPQSGVKARSCRNFIPQRIQFTPCTLDGKYNDGVLTETENDVSDNSFARNRVTDENDLRHIQKTVQGNELRSNCNHEKTDHAVEPKVLNFEVRRNNQSLDMFDNDVSLISSKSHVEPNISITEHLNKSGNLENGIVQEKKDNVKPLETSKLHDQNHLISASKKEKQTHVIFKEPLTGIGVPDIIPIKKGGKNWRRTIMFAPGKRISNNCDVLGKGSTNEFKILPRKSSAVIEPKGRSSRIVTDGMVVSEVGHISIMEDSVFENEQKTKVISENIQNEVEYDFSVDEELASRLQTSCNVAKSSSYIVPLDMPSDSILAEPNVDDLAKVLSKCSVKEIIGFQDLFEDKVLENLRKIGEGSYGEVFKGDLNGTDLSVLKIVPVGGTTQVNGSPQTKLSDILAEIAISKELNRLRDYTSKFNVAYSAQNFITLRKCTLVEGSYPPQLLKLWDDYDENKTSENERPDDDLFFDETSSCKQRFMVLEYEDGGKDLETFEMKNAVQGISIFLQVAFTLAGNLKF